jgi:hypothetical protein
MLAVQKQDKDQNATEALTASGFAKVLSSIQGLQQRLGDFSYGEVSIAEAKVKLLVKQLGALREHLGTVAKLKHAVSETNRQIIDLPEESFDLVELDSLEKHPQLHAIIRASTLLHTQGHMTMARTRANTNADGTGTDEVVMAPFSTEELRDNDKPEAALPGEHQKTAFDPTSTKSAPLVTAASDKPAVPLKLTFEDPEELSLDKPKRVSSARPSKQTFPARVDQTLNRPPDWTFDFDETPAEPLDFEFPAETSNRQEPRLPKSPSKSVNPANLSEKAQAGTALDADLTGRKAKTSAHVDQRQAKKPLAEKALAKLDESRALVPTNHDYDHRLLAEVIKNYGDFSAWPNLPATIASPGETKPGFDKPQANHGRPFDEPAAKLRDVANNKKAGDLDRQLKKIIKDYGEYDLYQRRSVVNFKTGGIAAFVVLGLVLAGLYFFGGPSTAREPSPPLETRPLAAERSTPLQTSIPVKASAGGAEKTAATSATNDPSVDPATVTKETP